MGRSHESFSKREKEKKKAKKKKEKAEKREARKEESTSGSLDDMIAYVDEYGNILDAPPDPSDKEEIAAEDIVVGIPPKEESDEITQGKVAYFDDSKGYGFITDLNGGDKYFFHISNTLEDVVEGDKVTFDLEKGPKGMNAVSVKKV